MPAHPTSAIPGDPADLVRRLFDVAIARAHPNLCLAAHLPEPARGERILVLGAGKAAAAMAIATEANYANLPSAAIGGHVTTRYGYGLPNPTARIAIGEAAHPIPDDASEAAATRALASARLADGKTRVIVLLSGGASALWSHPVASVPFEAKQHLTRHLLASGATIGDINTVRRHISGIKGGKLARAAANAAGILTLAISDVPGDRPEAIGSGPTVADPTTLGDARRVLERFKVTAHPAIAAALLVAANETVKAADPALSRADYRIIAAPRASLEAAAHLAASYGYRAIVLSDALEGEASTRGFEHAQLALAHRARGERVAILSGGELTVTIAGTGVGGPNQEYALALAIGLGGATGITAIAGDTDGTDGGRGHADDPAGALVLPQTLALASVRGMDAATALANNDSTNFFRTLGHLVETGPTQTNVNDFRAILVDP